LCRPGAHRRRRPRIRMRPVAGLPLIHVEPPDLAGRAKVVKD
jgi:hypothetical protein